MCIQMQAPLRATREHARAALIVSSLIANTGTFVLLLVRLPWLRL
jgi:hypothetical protein